MTNNQDNIYYGIDFALGPARTVIVMMGRSYGKTYLMKMWAMEFAPDLLSRQLIRKLAAEAIITISLTS